LHIKEGRKLTIDVFPLAPSELESELFVKEGVNQEGVDAEEFEREGPTIEAAEIENQDDLEDPIRLYLHEIGRVPLLSASSEKTIARRIEIGKCVNVVKKGLGKNGKCAAASETYLDIIRELGESQEIIIKLEENVGLDKNTMFRQIVNDKKFRDAIDGVIDQATILAISEKLGLAEAQPVEQGLIALSVNSALLSEVVLTAIGTLYR
jgi:RNA polymerase primary sigma factor